MNHMVDVHQMDLKKYAQIPDDITDSLFVETDFMNRKYHIPVKYVKLWAKNNSRGDIILEILDKMTTVRK